MTAGSHDCVLGNTNIYSR